MARPRSMNPLVTVATRIDVRVEQALRQVAKEQGTSLSVLISRILAKWYSGEKERIDKALETVSV